MHKPIPDHRYHHLTDPMLHYIIKDAGEAARNMRDMNYEAECKYLDQVNDACTVLRYRRECMRASAHRMLAAHNADILQRIHDARF